MNRFSKRYARLWALLLAAALFLSFPACGAAAAPAKATAEVQTLLPVPEEDGSYTTAEDVCAYLLTYGRLPDNFITKKEAKALGWSSGALEKYAPGKCIGGDSFGNREGCCPPRPAGPGKNATSTRWARAHAGMSGWSIPTTG